MYKNINDSIFILYWSKSEIKPIKKRIIVNKWWNMLKIYLYLNIYIVRGILDSLFVLNQLIPKLPPQYYNGRGGALPNKNCAKNRRTKKPKKVIVWGFKALYRGGKTPKTTSTTWRPVQTRIWGVREAGRTTKQSCMPPYLYTWRVKMEETAKNSGSHQPVRRDAVLSKRPSEIALISCAWGSAPASGVLIWKRPAPGEVRGGEAGKKWRTRK